MIEILATYIIISIFFGILVAVIISTWRHRPYEDDTHAKSTEDLPDMRQEGEKGR